MNRQSTTEIPRNQQTERKSSRRGVGLAMAGSIVLGALAAGCGTEPQQATHQEQTVGSPAVEVRGQDRAAQIQQLMQRYTDELVVNDIDGSRIEASVTNNKEMPVDVTKGWYEEYITFTTKRPNEKNERFSAQATYRRQADTSVTTPMNLFELSFSILDANGAVEQEVSFDKVGGISWMQSGNYEYYTPDVPQVSKPGVREQTDGDVQSAQQLIDVVMSELRA